MASTFAKSLLAFAVAVVVGGVGRAQDEAFAEGVKHLRLGQSAEALAKFQEVLAKDPSNEQALQLYRSVEQDVWVMLLNEKGEIQKIAQSILERAKLEKVARSRDEAAIGALVDQATAADGTYESRREAVLKLSAEHGEFAVPALVAKLANDDDDKAQINAIYALSQIGHTAVLPLCEATKSSSATVRLNAAAALSHIGDARAVPTMARLAQTDDQENVREVARRFLAKHDASGAAADLYLAQSRGYLRGGVGQGAQSDVVWSLKDDKLVAQDVPAATYSIELAKAAAHDAVAIDPQSQNARAGLAAAYLAHANVIETSAAQNPDGELAALAPMVGELKVTALASGPAVLRQALTEAVRDGIVPVAVGAIDALAVAESRDSLAGSPLVAALDSSDSRISYAAAMALVKASGGSNVPAGDKVVSLLASAVTEESIRMIQVIDNSSETRRAASEANTARGARIWVDASARDGMSSILNNPEVDVVVINEILPDRVPEDVIGLLKRDPRTADVKVVVMAKDVEKAKERFGDSVTAVIEGPVTGDSLTAAVNSALEGVAVEPRNARAEQVAAGASAALEAMASAKSGIGGALGSLAAQLDRADAVAVPAAKALGMAGGEAEVGALVAALGGGGSLELKCAAAEAIGAILARTGAVPAGAIEGLGAVLHSDADLKLRTACAVAIGKARISDADKARLLDSLRKVGGKAEG